MGCTYLYFSCGVWNYLGAGGGRVSGGGGDFNGFLRVFVFIMGIMFYIGYLLIVLVEFLSFSFLWWSTWELVLLYADKCSNLLSRVTLLSRCQQ